jgi:enamine deaminase RidA (YjgF/YER057c/UK114 family)
MEAAARLGPFDGADEAVQGLVRGVGVLEVESRVEHDAAEIGTLQGVGQQVWTAIVDTPVPATRVRSVTGCLIRGQVARDAGGRPGGEGDLAAQVEQCYLNVATALAGAGGSFDDVAKPTVYVVDWCPEKMPLPGEGVSRAAARLGIDPVKPITLLGVAARGEPDLLVEVEATAVTA